MAFIVNNGLKSAATSQMEPIFWIYPPLENYWKYATSLVRGSLMSTFGECAFHSPIHLSRATDKQIEPTSLAGQLVHAGNKTVNGGQSPHVTTMRVHVGHFLETLCALIGSARNIQFNNTLSVPPMRGHRVLRVCTASSKWLMVVTMCNRSPGKDE